MFHRSVSRYWRLDTASHTNSRPSWWPVAAATSNWPCRFPATYTPVCTDGRPRRMCGGNNTSGWDLVWAPEVLAASFRQELVCAGPRTPPYFRSTRGRRLLLPAHGGLPPSRPLTGCVYPLVGVPGIAGRREGKECDCRGALASRP